MFAFFMPNPTDIPELSLQMSRNLHNYRYIIKEFFVIYIDFYRMIKFEIDFQVIFLKIHLNLEEKGLKLASSKLGI